MDGVGNAGDVGIALLDNGQSEDGQVHGDDAATDRLPLALSGTAGTVARVAVGKEEADTGWVHNTLLHRETLLVVAAGDLEDVALELIANAVAGHLVTHAAVHEDAQLLLIFNVDEFLRAIGRETDVELHPGSGRRLVLSMKERMDEVSISRCPVANSRSTSVWWRSVRRGSQDFRYRLHLTV